MRKIPHLQAVAVAVLAGGLGAGHVIAADNPMVGGAPMFADKNIVENAVNSKDHTTLVTAVKAAGLVDTLSGAGPFTVFAPTNDAFAALPAGTVDDLLKPEKKDQLTKILTCHVVAADAMSEAIRKMVMEDGGAHKVKTVGGCEFTVKADGDKIMIGRDGQCRQRHHRRRRPVERGDPRHRQGPAAEVAIGGSHRAALSTWPPVPGNPPLMAGSSRHDGSLVRMRECRGIDNAMVGAHARRLRRRRRGRRPRP